MSFFKRLLGTTDSDGDRDTKLPAIGSGRQLRSELASTDCVANVEAILLSYRPPDSAYKTPYVVPGWQWTGPQDRVPQTVISFFDGNNEFLLAAFWPNHNGTECGLYPLGSGDGRLATLPIIGRWKQRDRSLTSVGALPARQIYLAPPHVPEQFVEEILSTGGYSPTPHNVAAIGMLAGRMFVSSARQFVASQDPQSADSFLQTHAAGGPFAQFYQAVLDELAAWSDGRGTGHFAESPAYTAEAFAQFYQAVLNDVSAWNSTVLPSIQDLPMRIRAVMLEGSHNLNTFWGDLER